MRLWSLILVAQLLGTTVPTQASSDYGSKDGLFNFADFEWMEDGVWLCDDECDPLSDSLFVYVEPAVSRLTVHIFEHFDDSCLLLGELMAGPVYKDIERAGFLTFVADSTADEDGPYILALDWTEFVNNETGYLFYVWVDHRGAIWSDIIDQGRSALEEFRFEYDPEDMHLFAGKLRYQGSTSSIQKAQLLEKNIGPIGPEYEWDDVKSNCLSVDQLEKLGLLR